MTKLNKALMASTAVAFAGGLALPASAQKAPDPSAAPGVVKSGKKMKLRLYGQITRQFGFVNDGETSTFKNGPNGNTSNRMGIDGRGKITKDINVRTRLEFAVQSGESGGGDQFENQAGGNDFDIRHADVIVSHKRYGAVYVGRGDGATNGIVEINLAPGMNTGRLGGSVANVVSEYIFLDKDDSLGTQFVATVGRFFNSFDGTSRQNRIRYDSPTFFGFKASASVIDKHNMDAALRYSGKIAGTAVKGGIGWCHTKGTQTAGTTNPCFGNTNGQDGAGTIQGIDQLSGSVSVLTPIGIGGAFSAGTQWRNRTTAGSATVKDPVNYVPSIFYTTKVTELGATTVEYAYQFSEDIAVAGDEGQGHAVSIVQKVDSVGGDYFVGFRYVEAETAVNKNIDDLWWIGGGFRQRF